MSKKERLKEISRAKKAWKKKSAEEKEQSADFIAAHILNGGVPKWGTLVLRFGKNRVKA